MSSTKTSPTSAPTLMPLPQNLKYLLHSSLYSQIIEKDHIF